MRWLIPIAFVIVVLLIIAIFSLPPPIPYAEEEKLTMNVGETDLEPREIEGFVHWDLTLLIKRITPKDEKVPWDRLRVAMTEPNGHEVLTSTRLQEDDAERYDSEDPVDVQAWFIEESGDGKASAGDSIKLTGLSREHQSCRVSILSEGERIGHFVLSSDFGG
jgi:hypothetical protein